MEFDNPGGPCRLGWDGGVGLGGHGLRHSGSFLLTGLEVYRGLSPKPRQNLFGVLVRGEDRIEHVLDHAVADDQSQPLVERQPTCLERRQAQFLL